MEDFLSSLSTNTNPEKKKNCVFTFSAAFLLLFILLCSSEVRSEEDSCAAQWVVQQLKLLSVQDKSYSKTRVTLRVLFHLFQDGAILVRLPLMTMYKGQCYTYSHVALKSLQRELDGLLEFFITSPSLSWLLDCPLQLRITWRQAALYLWCNGITGLLLCVDASKIEITQTFF